MARAAGDRRRTSPGAPRFDHDGLAGDPDPRRRRLPRPGHRGRDAQPVPPRRLLHRRHHPHHRQQPARLHHGAARRRAAPSTPATWPRASRSPSCTSTPTIRRPASRRRGWPGPTATRFRQGLPDRPGGLPPLRPQRRATSRPSRSRPMYRADRRPTPRCGNAGRRTLVERGVVRPGGPPGRSRRRYAAAARGGRRLASNPDHGLRASPRPAAPPPGAARGCGPPCPLERLRRAG